ncbi:MAG: serine/threonine protein kinase/formylglycine-generating enzyme required for sulfatase activity, partial [Kiritimatiellia bacterium]
NNWPFQDSRTYQLVGCASPTYQLVGGHASANKGKPRATWYGPVPMCPKPPALENDTHTLDGDWGVGTARFVPSTLDGGGGAAMNGGSTAIYQTRGATTRTAHSTRTIGARGEGSSNRRSGLSDDQLPSRLRTSGWERSGAMGTVCKVHDLVLNRAIAIKVLNSDASEPMRVRFLDEARITARMCHPNVVSVHDMGVLEDGRPWFTMEFVTGQTLADLIPLLHAFCGVTSWGETRDGWSIRRAIDVMVRVCDAVEHAHSNGVVHRDVKPQNVLLGDLDVVKLADWGIAKRFTAGSSAGWRFGVPTRQEAHLTQLGTVIGSPSYMSPEQASGVPEDVGPSTDVYALGATLYHLLSGSAPFYGPAEEVIPLLRTTAPPRMRDRLIRPQHHAPIPQKLELIVERAMQRQPGDRYRSAGALGRALQAWLADDAREDQAKQLLLAVTEREAEIDNAKARLQRLRDEAYVARIRQPTWASIEAKEPGWALQVECDAAAHAVTIDTLEIEEMLGASFSLAPQYPPARERLVQFYQQRLLEAEDRDDVEHAQLCVAMLRELGSHNIEGWLASGGSLSLRTDPPGASVRVFRYVERDRRLLPELVQDLGVTPLVRVPVPAGSLLLVIEHPEHQTVRYPVFLQRGEHWHGRAPGQEQATPIWLPEAGRFTEDQRYVPAGWYRAGGLDAVDAFHPRRLWLNGFVIDRLQVTVAEWIEFATAMADEGHTADAERALSALSRSAYVATVAVDGHVLLDASGLDRSLPIAAVEPESARRFVTWRSERDGQPWRLPSEYEWEKAARGVDGRRMPWGRHIEPAFAHFGGSQKDPCYLPVGSFETDRSVYGVQDMAGGVSDLTLSPWMAHFVQDGQVAQLHRVAEGEEGVRKGGRMIAHGSTGMAAARVRVPTGSRVVQLGLRLTRSVP